MRSFLLLNTCLYFASKLGRLASILLAHCLTVSTLFAYIFSPYRITSKKTRDATSSLSRSNSIGNGSYMANNDGPLAAAVAPQFDYSLDLGMYKNQMFQLWSAENRGRWFELSSNNAVLSFLLAVSL